MPSTPRRFRVAPSTVIATIALIFAMTGGAYAAKKYLITSTKQISPSVLKSLKGAAGKNGVAGLAGPTGPAGTGTAGPVGPAGPNGTAGADGKDGAEGKEGKQGKEGKAGKDGSPWTAGGTLPAGATETGLWTVGPTNEETVFLSASFTIPLASALAETSVHFINQAGKEEPEPEVEVTSTACLGTVADPKAASGNLCVYAAEVVNALTGNVGIENPSPRGQGAGKTGATIILQKKAAGIMRGTGTWAVTG